MKEVPDETQLSFGNGKFKATSSFVALPKNVPFSGQKIDMPTEDDFQEPLLERLSATPEPDDPARTSKKRKRGAVEQGAKKAAKKAKPKKGNADEDEEIDIENGINKAFAQMDNQLLADYVAQRTRRYESDLSLVELEDKYISGGTDCF